jgi:hypothetical protein
MENFFSEIISSIVRYFSIIVLLIFKKERSSIFFFNRLFRKTRKVKINPYAILAFTILYYFVIKAIVYYFNDNLEKSYISELLTNKYLNSEGFFRLLVTLVPFIIIIHLFCYFFASNKRTKEQWIDFFIMNFSAQIFGVITLISFGGPFFNDNASLFLKIIGVLFGIIIIIFVLTSFTSLSYAVNLKLISKDAAGRAVLFSIFYLFAFIYLFSFGRINEKMEYRIFYKNKIDENTAIAKIDSISSDSFKLSIKCVFLLESKASIIIGESAKSSVFFVTWPLLNNFSFLASTEFGKYIFIDTSETEHYNIIAKRISIESNEDLIYIKPNQPHPLTLISYLTRIQMLSLVYSTKTKYTNHFKIISHGVGQQENERVVFYDNRLDLIVNSKFQ